MSVREGDRGKRRKFGVLDLSRKLAVHTITVCRNTDAFPKSQRWIFTKRIVDHAMDVHDGIAGANKMLMAEGPTLEVEYAERRRMQDEALAALEELMADIDIADKLCGLGERAGYWMGLACDVDDALRSWMRSDKGRYLALRGSG